MRERHRLAGQVKVGHAIYALKAGGEERELLNIINYGDHSRFYHVILCFTEADAFASQLDPSVCKLIEFHKGIGNDLRLPCRIAAAVRRHQLDILHARAWATLVEASLAASLTKVRGTVYAFHGKTLEELQGTSLKRRCVEKFLLCRFHQVVTLSRRMRSDMVTRYGLSEDRIQVIPNGVDIEIFRPYKERKALRERFGLPTNRFIIGNVARLDPIKNHEVILRALRRLKERTYKPLFLLVGEGAHRPVLEREIERLGLSTDVRLVGYSDRVPELMNCMDLYIQSSFYEGSSHTVVEAMACGLPVLATDVGGMADLLSEGHEGRFFGPQDDDKLARLIAEFLQNDAPRHIMGERARHRAVEHFSVRTMVHNYEALYLDLAAATVGRTA